ncbi:MAG: hypothetical protein KJ939_00880 [Nanoarchaeota archaeon]|nr:hypothetical protein [Nanoarchaeota archaeon]
MADIADIQNFKKFRSFKSKYGLSPKIKYKLDKKIIEKLNISQEELDNRLSGLEAEDEFLLMTYLIANIEQITPLEQKQLFNKNKYTVPDYLLSVPVSDFASKLFLKKDTSSLCQRMFVEVKKCKKDEREFVITKKAYEKLRHYAELYSLPLYFALKFNMSASKQWFFITGKVIEKFGKEEKRHIINREQDCYVIDITKILKYDFSGLWLNNFACFVSKSTKIRKIYDNSIKKFNISHPKLGAIISHNIISGRKEYKIDLLQKDFLSAIVRSAIVEVISSQGKKKQFKKGNQTIIESTLNNNSCIPYAHLVLETYLYFKNKIQQIKGETDNTPEYYVENFSEFDMNLVNDIHKHFFELVDEKVIVVARMMPNLS